MITVEDLLDQIQQLIGEEPGDYYNISQRLLQLSQAQQELVDETSALLTDAELSVTASNPIVELPEDFQRLGDRQPVFTSGGIDYPLKVVAPRWLDEVSPAWRRSTITGTPEYLVQEGTTLRLYPTPRQSGTLDLNYIPIPQELTEMDQLPFNGRRDLNRYAPALAYKVAFLITMPRAPQLGQLYENMYIREERKLRHFVRSNAQKTQSIYPTVRWSDRASAD